MELDTSETQSLPGDHWQPAQVRPPVPQAGRLGIE